MPVTTTLAMNRSHACRPMPSSQGPPLIVTIEDEKSNKPECPQPNLSTAKTTAKVDAICSKMPRGQNQGLPILHITVLRDPGCEMRKAAVHTDGRNMTTASQSLIPGASTEWKT